MRRANQRDYFAAALIALLGAGAVVQGSQYGVGTLTNMGSGFFPVALGVGMVVLGVMMAVVAGSASDADGHTVAAPDWRGAFAITLAVVLFIALAGNAGLAPATFACVFVAALGTRSTTWVEALLLALGVTVFGVALFVYGLKVPFPIVRGVLQ